jgi:peptidoglycan/LPS O-acetylase OafA/YrhL
MPSSSSPTAQQRPSAREPILPLTSVRFFAAISVVIFHSYFWLNDLNVSTWSGRALRNAFTAVGFFFVLSGYILTHVYLNTNKPLDRRAFWTSRFARAYPLLFASLLLDVPNNLINRFAVHQSIKHVVVYTFSLLFAEAALMQSWFSALRGHNGPSWSLSTEAFFYFVFPFTALWICRRKRALSLALLAFFWCCAMFAPFVATALRPEIFVEVNSTLQQTIELAPVFRIFEFFAGISLCAFQQSVIANRPSAQRQQLAWIALAIAGVLFFFAIEFANHVPLLVMSNGFLLPVYALAILALVNMRGWLQRLLSNKILVILGESSYAVYLLHAPLWLYLSRIHPIDTLHARSIYYLIVIGLSVASFYLLERHARKKILAFAAIRPPITLQQELNAPL